MFLIATSCSQAITVTASRPAISKSSYIGKFLFYKIGLNGLPIYKNSQHKYFYLDTDGLWTVSFKY